MTTSWLNSLQFKTLTAHLKWNPFSVNCSTLVWIISEKLYLKFYFLDQIILWIIFYSLPFFVNCSRTEAFLQWTRLGDSFSFGVPVNRSAKAGKLLDVGGEESRKLASRPATGGRKRLHPVSRRIRQLKYRSLFSCNY